MIKSITQTFVGILFISLIIISCQPKLESKVVSPIVQHEAVTQTTHKVDFEGLSIGEPIAFKNLQIFPITGLGALNNVSYLTLGVAMETDKVIVHETGSVNNLSITNKSDEYIYIQSGDIVKGGRQDRTIQYDVLIPPGAKKMSLNSFCVEQSRWSKRGDEVASQFSTSKKMLSNRETKLAAKSNGDQSYVWSSVAKTQDKINGTLKEEVSDTVDITSNASATSLQLALENKELEKLIEEYKTVIEMNMPTDSLLGFAYAVNGEFYGIEAYNNSLLFLKMKNKLIESVVTEAIAEKNNDELEYKTLTLSGLLSVLNSTNYKSEEMKLNKACMWISSVDEKSKIHNYTLVDLAHGNKWLHKNWVNGFGVEKVERSSIDVMRSNDIRSVAPSNVYPLEVERIEVK